MAVENILIVVYIWHHAMPGQFTQEIYGNVIDRAKDLLQELHLKVIQAEEQLNKELSEAHHKSRLSQGRSEPLPMIGYSKNSESDAQLRKENLIKYGKAKRS